MYVSRVIAAGSAVSRATATLATHFRVNVGLCQLGPHIIAAGSAASRATAAMARVVNKEQVVAGHNQVLWDEGVIIESGRRTFVNYVVFSHRQVSDSRC